MPFERESFVSVCTSPTFVCTSRIWRYSDFKISEMRQEEKSIIFQDIEMGLTAFEKESFIPVCTLKNSEIQRFSNFGNVPRREVDHF